MTASDDRMVAVRADDVADAVLNGSGMSPDGAERIRAALDGPEVIPVPVEDVAAIRKWRGGGGVMVAAPLPEHRAEWFPAVTAVDNLCALYDPPPPEPEFTDEQCEQFATAMGWFDPGTSDRTAYIDQARRALVAAASIAGRAEPGDKP